MGDVLAEVVPLGIAVAASPFPIIPAVLLLFTARARASSLGLILGWTIGVLLAAGVFVGLATVVERADEPPSWASWVRIGLGLLLIGLGVRKWATRKDAGEDPAWMQSIDQLTPRTAARLGFLLSAANPKVLMLTAAAGLALGSADLATADIVAGLAVFTAIAASTVTLPLLLNLLFGERILGPLGRVRTWLQQHNTAVMAGVVVVIGGYLVVKGVSGI
jgi:threonine/homoserine/homoserine lactone efflux protein